MRKCKGVINKQTNKLELLCQDCIYQSDKALKSIVRKLASKVYSEQKVCQHYIRK